MALVHRMQINFPCGIQLIIYLPGILRAFLIDWLSSFSFLIGSQPLPLWLESVDQANAPFPVNEFNWVLISKLWSNDVAF